MPVLTRLLSKDAFGTYSVYQVLLAFTVPLVGQALQFNIARQYHVLDRRTLAREVGNLYWILGTGAAVTLVALAAYFTAADELFGIPPIYAYCLIPAAAGTAATQFALVLMRNQGRPYLFAAFEVGNTALTAGTTLTLILKYGWSWEALPVAVVLSYAITGIVSFVYIRTQGYVTGNLDWTTVRRTLGISLPLIPHALSTVAMSVSDRLFVDRMLGKEAVAIYSGGYTIGMVVLLFTDAFNKAWSPWMFKTLAEIDEPKKRHVVRLTYGYLLCVAMLAALLALVAPPVVRWLLPEGYGGATALVGWVAAGYAAQAGYFMVFPYFVHAGKTSTIALFSTLSAAVNVVANYLLIGANGLVGAAQATLIAYTLLFLSVWWAANRVFPMPWRLQPAPQGGTG